MTLLTGLIEWSRQTFVPFGAMGLFAIAFAESSFFPIPPDVVLIPLVLLKPEYALWYALICTIGSTLGAVFGYYLGKKGGRRVLKKLVCDKTIDKVDDAFKKHGVFAVGVAAFSPIPFKVFAIAAGVFELDLMKTVVVSFICRGARFFSIAIVLMLFGEKIMDYLTNYFELITFIILLVSIVFYWLYRKRKSRAKKNAQYCP